jgi:hypothetical protein
MMERYNVPKFVNVSNLPDAESVYERIKKREAIILAGMNDTQALIVEYHATAQMVVRVAEVGYYADSDDTLLLVGKDAATGDYCEVMVPSTEKSTKGEP